MKNTILILVVSLLGSLPCKAMDKTDLLGSWRIIKLSYALPDRTVQVESPQPGALVVSPKRYSIMYTPGKEPRVPFKVLAKPTDSEIIAGFRSIVFNSGSYTLQGNTLVTKADMAKVPGFEGGQQFFEVLFDNEQLQLTFYDEIYPDGTRPAWAGKSKLTLTFIKE